MKNNHLESGIEYHYDKICEISFIITTGNIIPKQHFYFISNLYT